MKYVKNALALSATARFKRVAICAIVLGAGLAIIPACSPSENDSGANLTADMAMVRKRSFEITTTASGQLEAKAEFEVRSKVESRTTIVELAKEGTLVKPGDLLVQLASEQIEKAIVDENARVQSSRSDLITAENNLAMQEIENTSRLRKAELKLDLSRSAMDQWRQGDVAIRRMTLDLAVEKTERELARAEERFARSNELKDKGFLSKEDWQKDSIAVIEWTSESKKAKKSREVYNDYEFVKDEKVKLGDVADSDAELKRVMLQNEKELAVKHADLENKREQLRIREANLVKLNEQLTHTIIRAPREGMVVYATSMGNGRWDQGALQVGKEVQNNEQILSLPDTTEMVASVKVHESLAGRVRPGMPASVKVDAAGGRVFAGVVDSIGVLAESNGWRDPNLREYTVKISLTKTDSSAALKPSMRADATIVLGSVEDTLSVPVQAVFNEGAVRFAYLQDGSKFTRVPVKLGRRSDAHAEIAAGLKEGDTVLLRQPTAGEVMNHPWNPDELKVAGYVLNENGQPMEIAATPEGMPPMNMPAMNPGNNASPGGAAGSPTQGPRGNRGGKTRPQNGKPAAAPASETKPATETPVKTEGSTTTVPASPTK